MIDIDPAEDPTWRFFRQIITMSGGHRGKESFSGGNPLRGFAISFEAAPAGQGELEEEEWRVGSTPHAVPPIWRASEPRLDHPEEREIIRPPRRPAADFLRCLNETPDARLPARRRERLGRARE